MPTNRKPSTPIRTAYYCGRRIGQHVPGAEHVIRVFGYLPSEITTEWERQAFTKMQHSKWWQYFWKGHADGVRAREAA